MAVLASLPTSYFLLPTSTQLRDSLVRPGQRLEREADPELTFRHRHFRTARLGPTASITADRIPLLFNQDVALDFVQPTDEDAYFYRNAQGDEVVCVSDGAGVLETQLGEIDFRPGDYLVVPRGILHRYRFTAQPVRCLVIESRGYVRMPKRYRNEHGQLTENAPFSERDIRRPANLQVHDGRGDFRLPPPTHQTFESDNFVICSFCPRPYDFDPRAVPVPYNHSNVMSDEVLHYASSEFMSRKGIEYGSVTLHPDGVPQGPHPGRMEQSLGQHETNELAVMVDTFHTLQLSRQALAVEDSGYFRSWVTT